MKIRHILTAMFLLTGWIGFQAAKAADLRCFTRNYQWQLDGNWYSLSLEFPWEGYDFYASVPRLYTQYGVYTYEHPTHAVLGELTAKLHGLAGESCLDEWNKLRLTAAFVQHLMYQPEPGEYPKFPMETLAEKGGDCEDLSILLAAVLREMGFDAVLINPTGHMAVGLACKNCEGTYFQLAGRKYYYIETTAKHYAIGEAPEEYRSARGKLYTAEMRAQAMKFLANVAAISESDRPMYYVREDEVSRSVPFAGRELFASSTVRTMTVNGSTHTTTLVTAVGDPYRGTLSPLAWAAEQWREQR